MGNYRRAITDYNRAIRLEPTAEAFGGRALSHLHMGNYRRAIADLSEAIRIAPNIADLFVSRGQVHLEMGNPDQAIADFEAALRIDPNNTKAQESLSFARFFRMWQGL